jgi:hypothetical protein
MIKTKEEMAALAKYSCLSDTVSRILDDANEDDELECLFSMVEDLDSKIHHMPPERYQHYEMALRALIQELIREVW